MDTYTLTGKLAHTQAGVEQPVVETADALGRQYTTKRIQALILAAGAPATTVAIPAGATHFTVVSDKGFTVEWAIAGPNVIPFPITKPTGAAETAKVHADFWIPTGATVTLQNNHATLDAQTKVYMFGP